MSEFSQALLLQQEPSSTAIGSAAWARAARKTATISGVAGVWMQPKGSVFRYLCNPPFDSLGPWPNIKSAIPQVAGKQSAGRSNRTGAQCRRCVRRPGADGTRGDDGAWHATDAVRSDIVSGIPYLALRSLFARWTRPGLWRRPLNRLIRASREMGGRAITGFHRDRLHLHPFPPPDAPCRPGSPRRPGRPRLTSTNSFQDGRAAPGPA